MSAHETPFGAGAIDRIAEQVEQLRAELERQRARAEKLEKALRDAARSFESIQIRCREGDKTVDWLPTIDNIATNARVAALAAGGAQ